VTPTEKGGRKPTSLLKENLGKKKKERDEDCYQNIIQEYQRGKRTEKTKRREGITISCKKSTSPKKKGSIENKRRKRNENPNRQS